MKGCGSGIPEIDENPETNIGLIPILQEILGHLNELEKTKEGLVYTNDQIKLIVKRHDDHIPIFDVNKWGYGRIYFYVPWYIKDVKAYLRKEIEEEIRRIKELYQELCVKKGERWWEG
ncbi:MAG: hypothetical protein QW478_13765 [Candidatus Micrarchaeaceae archaeon]